ncbi:iron(III) transport system ATP-binding protein/putative spermidine/putrescine transport system ATP-binding protein [Bosea sp. BE125]|uniref:ABC transporter ATP-binding protein n=1 Tax=Bosea sp. BE125 TaxID=2817909 RepID=UPI002859FDEF|nr:ABC transporter ATP-binding protein [Bosea sp. BE125]MDR6873947.1 iron(III) transport system ATP-binding protein/putative spermidine/putrescine transport system ATP-binding protein [Bosea sp. BE125]
MSALSFERLGKSYGEAEVVREVSLTIAEGEFVSLLGPSGCGKTTILRMVAGLVAPSRGRILIGSDDVTSLPPNKRGLGLVFQSYALFPHLTVFENVAFGLRRRKVSGAELDLRVKEALARVRLDAYGERFPRQLSGGQQQRVAIARAIAPQPRVLLFDEPLSNLDAQLRDEMQIELKRLQRGLGITTLFVTHDQGEALSMSDRVCVMAKGVMQQFATPEDIYHRPATGFVASFIGRPNRLSGVVATRDGQGGSLRLGSGLTLQAAHIDAAAGAKVDVVIRQEAIRLRRGQPEPDAIAGTVALRSFSGARVQYVVKLTDGVELIAETPSSGPDSALDPGTPVSLVIDAGSIFAMASEGAAA